MDKKYLIVIGGATASGKTSLAIQLAKHYATEIISADSRQIYTQMNIGTAKPTAEELNTVKHHFVHQISIHEPYNVGQYERDVMQFLNDWYATKNIAVLVGGTGLYIQAVCEGIDDFPEVPISIRHELQELWQEKGLSYLQEELQRLDNEYYQIVDKQNPKRLLRALEICRTTGKPYSQFRTQTKAARLFTPIYIALDHPRELLYERIHQRIEEMIESGLEEEARQLYPFRHLNALMTVGYQEWTDYFEGTKDRQTVIEQIKQNTRNYAKRQYTWFRRIEAMKWFSYPYHIEEIIQYIDEKIALT